MVIALLVLIVLILLLGPGAIWNLIVWLFIGALLLIVGVIILLLYQAYPEHVTLFGLIFVGGFIWTLIQMRQQEQHARKKWEK